jgi:hypothetical protein
MNRSVCRRRLPNRRGHEILSFRFRGLAYTAGVGRFDDGRLAEIFVDFLKPCSPLADDARDAAVAFSIAAQYGVPCKDIRAAVTRDSTGEAAGVLGQVLDLLNE